MIPTVTVSAYPEIILDTKQAKRFLQGAPWAYANEIVWDQVAKTLAPGSIVQVVGRNGPLGLAFYNRHSLIVLRLLTPDSQVGINSEFFYQKLQRALHLRQQFYLEPYYRLVHAEADALPGLIIDRFNDILVVQLNSAGAEQHYEMLIEALQRLLHPRTIVLQRSGKQREAEKLALLDPECIGESIQELKIIENGVEFSIPWQEGQKTGWFYDHRENRKRLAQLAKGKKVLDYFCYAGGFSVTCALAGATQVIGIDRAPNAIAAATQAAIKNQVLSRTSFTLASAFEDIEARCLRKETAELVILDPPAFIKSKKDYPSGLKGYQKLISKALPLISQDGILLIASCSYHLSETDLKGCLARALHHHQRQGRILERLSTGPDHPKHPFLEEVDYLKGFLVQLD